ncbi:MAG: sensor histidine kinase [Hyphomicrobiaceae bacterium]
MLNRTRFRNTTGMRLALRFALLFACATAIILTAIYNLVTWEFHSRLQSRIRDIQSSMVRLGKERGFSAVATSIQDHARAAQEAEIVYLLVDHQGAFVAGNLRDERLFDGWRTLPWSRLTLIGTWTPKESDEGVIASWVSINQSHLLVGIGNGDIVEAGDIIRGAFLIGIAVATLVGIAGGLVLGAKADQSIQNIGATLNAVASGDLGARIRSKTADGDLQRVSVLINHMLDRLRSQIERLRQVSADIAHDLRTPLSHVQHSLEFISDGDHALSEVRSRAASAQQELRAVLTTFEAILRSSEIESGLRKAKFSKVDLRDVAQDVVDAFGPVAEEAGQVLQSQICDASALVQGDSELLRQLLVNVVKNSIQHCPKGAKITVSVCDGNARTELRVCDTGDGIPESERVAVFQRYYRAQSSDGKPGHGVGLSLVAAIAELHGAELALEDNQPGLRFIIYFGPSRIA